MKAPEIPSNEKERQLALESLNILETAIEERFERVTRLASRLIGVPIVAISMIDNDRQWFKSLMGLKGTEFRRSGKREFSVCGQGSLSQRSADFRFSRRNAGFFGGLRQPSRRNERKTHVFRYHEP